MATLRRTDSNLTQWIDEVPEPLPPTPTQPNGLELQVLETVHHPVQPTPAKKKTINQQDQGPVPQSTMVVQTIPHPKRGTGSYPTHHCWWWCTTANFWYCLRCNFSYPGYVWLNVKK